VIPSYLYDFYRTDINVILAYYKEASKNENYSNKITNQKFDFDYIKGEIKRLMSYKSSSLHWNLSQMEKATEIFQKALQSYEKISKKTGVEMHSKKSANNRLSKIMKDVEDFKKLSRSLAKKAQARESVTIQPKEHISGEKAMITIKNYLGGYYFFTCDEVEIYEDEIYLIEAKHSRTSMLPSSGDIKDGLLKMVLYCNLSNVFINKEEYKALPVLKLTFNRDFDVESLNKNQKKLFKNLKKESKINGFKLQINDNQF
jgi:hypothetical protein